jgi:hypothetical protein
MGDIGLQGILVNATWVDVETLWFSPLYIIFFFKGAVAASPAHRPCGVG